MRRIEDFTADDFITLSKQWCAAQADEVVVRLFFLRWAEIDLAAATAALIEMEGLSASHGARAIAVRLMRTDVASARRWAASAAIAKTAPQA